MPEAVRTRGLEAVTNFDLHTYIHEIGKDGVTPIAGDGQDTAAQGPAMSVEPSAQAMACVSALFARIPFELDAAEPRDGAACQPTVAPAAALEVPPTPPLLPPTPPSPIPRRLTF